MAIDEISIKKLILAAPLVYRKDDSPRFPMRGAVREEVLFRMALDPDQCFDIEPDRTAFPGRLVEAGYAAPPGDAQTPGLLELPKGTYFFAQVKESPGRETVDMETLIDMIIEVQKEGLWERFTLNDCLYIRGLFKNEEKITQVFRPVLQKDI